MYNTKFKSKKKYHIRDVTKFNVTKYNVTKKVNIMLQNLKVKKSIKMSMPSMLHVYIS